MFCSLEGVHLHSYIEYIGLTFAFVILIFQYSVQHKIGYCPLLVRLDCGATDSEPFGFWEIHGLGLITLYKSDWDKIGGMNVKEFKEQWGGEDWEFVDRLLEAGVEVERLKTLHFFTTSIQRKSCGITSTASKRSNFEQILVLTVDHCVFAK